MTQQPKRKQEHYRKVVWTHEETDCCAWCGRVPYRRRDGREYLYQYIPDGLAVCKPLCHDKVEGLV